MTLARTRYTAGQVIRAWSPFLFLTATVTLWERAAIQSAVRSWRRDV